MGMIESHMAEVRYMEEFENQDVFVACKGCGDIFQSMGDGDNFCCQACEREYLATNADDHLCA